MVFRQSGFRNTKPNSDPMGGNFPLIPEGEYLVVLKKVEEKTSSGGYDMVKVRWMILDDGEWLGKLIFDQIVFCQSMSGRNKHILKVLEQPCEEKNDEEELVIDSAKWLGQEARVVVVHEEYPKGTTRAKVSQYLYKNEEAEKAAHSKNGKKKPGATVAKEKEPVDESSDTAEGGEDGESIPF